tara:strand:+ start:905 stop:2293 length:1389 start_codon:yes stop_codon:yes gene_type:complete
MTSTIKVNTIQNTCGADIIKESGNTITIGASGDTITLGSGASQTGFGRTGTVDWQTSIKTAASFTAVNGEGYFVDTSSNTVTANLPAGSVGAIVAFKDYANNFDTNKLIINSNGSEKINNSTLNLDVITEGESLTLIYADATRGWLVVNDGNNDAGQQASFVAATGGTVTTCGDFKIHTFTGPGTFCVSSAGNAAGSNVVDYLVVAGGASGGHRQPGNGNGGGGAGGFRYSAATYCSPSCAPGHPLRSPTGLAVPVQGYPITVGAGGAAVGPSITTGNDGANSIFSSITSTGGGGGGHGSAPNPGRDGGSGGGGGGGSSSAIPAGAGNTPPVSPSQGNPGGSGGGQSPDDGSGGGGGATAAGTPKPSQGPNGNGGAGAGLPTAFGSNGQSCGSFRFYSGGGGTGASPGYGSGSGGVGGGAPAEGDGSANTGGGGGGGQSNGGGSGQSGSGGSGIVVIRYKFQ